MYKLNVQVFCLYDVVFNFQDTEDILRRYLHRFTDIAGSMINCGSVLNWFEVCDKIHFKRKKRKNY